MRHSARYCIGGWPTISMNRSARTDRERPTTRASPSTVHGSLASPCSTTRHFAFRYRSPEHWVDVFRTYYGPVHKAFAALDARGQVALEADLIALLRQANRGGEGSLVVPAEYLETVITR